MGSVMVLKLPKIVHFLQIYADRKKPKYIKAILYYKAINERIYHNLSENSTFYRGPRY